MAMVKSFVLKYREDHGLHNYLMKHDPYKTKSILFSLAIHEELNEGNGSQKPYEKIDGLSQIVAAKAGMRDTDTILDYLYGHLRRKQGYVIFGSII